MDRIIFGTGNPAKIKQIQGALAFLGITVEGLPDSVKDLKIEEDGQTAQDNARKKASAYAEAIGEPVLSMDNALFLNGLPADKQPSIHVRRINGATDRPSDEEMIAHYSKLIASLGERINGRWEFALCYAYPGGPYEETTIISPRIFVATPSPTILPGYPLESLQIDPISGKYISEMSQVEQDSFWEDAIGRTLADFIVGLRAGR